MVDFPNKERAPSRTTMGHASADPAPPSSGPRRCLVVGASVRAFVESAARAGWRPYAADLFADVDLAAAAEAVVRLGNVGTAAYPAGIPGVVAAFPQAACVYTGGLENHPDVLAAVAAIRPLAGCSPRAVQQARDPDGLARVAREAGLRFPESHALPDGLPSDGSFLVKPLRSAGGRDIRHWSGAGVGRAGPGLVWQRFVRGDPGSASYLATAEGTRLVGASRQLTGARWCGGRGFAYCGSVDLPLGSLPDATREALQRVGIAVATAFGLAGLFGIDLIVDADRHLHVLEVNPRPTASLELVERATGWSMAAAHLAAFGHAAAPPPPGTSPTGIWAKAIAFTPDGVTAARVAEAIAARAERWTAADGRPAVADIPRPEEPPHPGGPLVTVFARGETDAEAVATLRRRVRDLRSLVAGVSPRAGAPAAAPQPRGSTA